MAGRKSTPEPTFFSMLLGKLGLGSQPEAPKKRRRRAHRVAEVPEPTLREEREAQAEEDLSPFALYGAQSGLMERESSDEAAHGLSYAEAQAAGFAPPPPLTPPPPFDLPPAPGALPPRGGRLFQEDALDSSLDALFSGLESGVGQPSGAPVAGPVPSPPEKPSLAAAFDEFGLSAPSPIREPAAAVPPPARVVHAPIVTPIAPPPQPAPPPAAAAPSVRRPSAPQAPSALTALNQAPAPEGVLALAHGVALPPLMQALAQVPGAQGALLVGYDGLLIAAEVPPDMDADFLGAQAGTLFSSNDTQLSKLQRGPLRRMLLETADGAMLVTAADMGILVVVSRSHEALDVAATVATLQRILGAESAG